MHPTPTVPARTSRTARRVAGAALALFGLVAPLAATQTGPAAAAIDDTAVSGTADDTASRFTLAVLPDTQFYSRYSGDQFVPRYGSDPYQVQTEWLADVQDELRIPFTTHLGDVVDRVGVENEWRVADTAMSTLEAASLPYSILPGNHDVRNSDDRLTDEDYDLDAEPYLDWFGPDRAVRNETYGGSDPTGLSEYHVFEAEGQRFLVLAMTWRASDTTIAWANEVIDSHPTLPVILTTHSLIDVDTDGTTAKDTEYGLKLWDELIAPNDQIFLTFNGHFHGAARQTRLNDAGHEVTQILIDYQMAYDGGNGYLGLLEFDLTNDRISMQTASPWVTWKPQESLTAYDQPFLEGPNQQFTIDIDFSDRFGGFAPEFGPGTPDEPSLTQRARDLLLDGFTGPDPVTTQPPASTGDYPRVDGTLAHWRFGGLDGVLPENAVVPDVAGDNDMHRVPIGESGSPAARVEDVTVTHDEVHPLSSDGAAVCFADSDKTAQRLSYLATDADAPVNDVDLADGYTIETFLKIDGGFTEDTNAWMKALVRSGNRSRLPGMPWSRWDYTASPVALGLSNLKEFQWTEVPVETTKGDRTAWSGEIILDRWVHVALVNDPADSTTTMYVDGAPVLRNATDTLGHSIERDMPWLIGTDWVDDHATNGWHGCVGETRVIDHPTGPDEWLTGRADLDGLAVDLSDGDRVRHLREVTGTGVPGATVDVTIERNRPTWPWAGHRGGRDHWGSDHRGSDHWPWPPEDRRITTVVDDDGTWSARIRPQLRKGEYTLRATQSLGDRDSAPVEATFTVTRRPGHRG
ncbi:metallophosphoesterase [Myceligenerans pegani]|uniref:metallophosphoesterase n=1 Tax=Myceligenerans pegani TaxID=2776917 RepID=UPI00299E0709|nr:metallophosphoesterase [Myceligenerans sp. TRM 65318]